MRKNGRAGLKSCAVREHCSKVAKHATLQCSLNSIMKYSCVWFLLRIILYYRALYLHCQLFLRPLCLCCICLVKAEIWRFWHLFRKLREIVISVDSFSCRVSYFCLLLIKFESCRVILVKISSTNCREIFPVWTGCFMQTDGNSRCS